VSVRCEKGGQGWEAGEDYLAETVNVEEKNENQVRHHGLSQGARGRQKEKEEGKSSNRLA